MSTALNNSTKTYANHQVHWGGVIVASLVASVIMGMMSMMWEGLFGAGFWSPVVYIAATVLRDLQSVASPGFQLVPVMLGLMGHMMNSVILGGVFVVLIARRVRSTTARVVSGAAFGSLVFLGMWFVALPIIDPIMLQLSAVGFLLSHMLWGGALGFLARRHIH